MNSLVKVPPYSKLNFQGQIFFTQNWCNITLNCWNFLTWRKHLHDSLISEKEEVWAHKISLTQPLFIKVPVPSQKSERLYAWGTYIYTDFVSASTIFKLCLATFPTVWYFLFFYIIRKGNNMIIVVLLDDIVIVEQLELSKFILITNFFHFYCRQYFLLFLICQI